MIYHTQGKQTNNYTTEVVTYVKISFIFNMILWKSTNHIIYTEACINWTSLGPTFVFEIDSCSIYTG